MPTSQINKKHLARRFRNRLRSKRRLHLESLEPRHLLTGVSLLEETFFGGAGDQRGTDVELQGSDLFVSVNANETQTASASSFLVKYTAPTGPGTTPVFSRPWTLGTLNGVSPLGGNVYGAGFSHPGDGLTNDGTGGTEVKTLLTNFDANNVSGAGPGGSNWAAVIPQGTFNTSPGTSFFSYNGVENYVDAKAVDTSGTPFVYAIGHAQPCSHTTFVIGKYDAAGNVVAGATAASASFNTCSAPNSAKGAVFGIEEIGGSIYVAGNNHDNANISHPTVWKYDGNLAVQWKNQDAAIEGDFAGLATDGTSLYAVGQTRGPDTDYLIAKYDQAGNQLWRTVTAGGGTADYLRDVVTVGGRVFAVGYSNAPGAGGDDMVVLEVDPATGDVLATDTYGGAQTDRANRITTDGTDLYVIGESRSFAEGGNTVGQNDAVLLRFGINSERNPSPQITSLSVDQSMIFENESVTLSGEFADPLNPVETTLFFENFESYAAGSNLIGQGGWTLNPTSTAGGTSTLVDFSSGLGSLASHGRFDTGEGALVFADNIFAAGGGLANDRLYTLGFDALAFSGNPGFTAPAHNAGVYFRDTSNTNAAGWFTEAVGNDVRWVFDVRPLTGNAGNFQPFGFGQGISIPQTPTIVDVELSVVLDPVSNEVFGVADFGNGIPIETTHFAMSNAQFATIDGILLHQDYRNPPSFRGAEFDNIRVTETTQQSDEHTVEVNWGDGNVEQFILPVGDRAFSFPHQYLDDGPSPGNGTPQDDYTISITISDDDGGSDSTGGSGQWTQLAPLGTAPAPRNTHTAVYDDSSNTMIVFGGRGGPSDVTLFNDAWRLADANGNGTPEWRFVSPTGSPPAPRWVHQAEYDADTDRMIVHGGGRGFSSPCSNETWVLADAATGPAAWSHVISGGPAPRFGHSATYDSVNDRLTVFAGSNCFSSPSFGADVWVLANAAGIGTPVWTQLSPTGSITDRASHAAEYDPASNRMIVFGGGNNSGAPVVFNDVHVLTNANGLGGPPQWIDITPASGPAPTPRNGMTTVYDADDNRLVVFGGFDTALLNDVWVLNHANGLGGVPEWVEITPTTGPVPPPVSSHSMVFDPLNDRIITFGGRRGTSSPDFGNEVWTFDLDKGIAAPIVTVKNVAPELQDVSVTPMIFENDSATLSGAIVDPGTLDVFTLDIDWGDPLSPGDTQTLVLGSAPINSGGVLWNPATRQFSVDHQYLDDNPTNTTQDDYTISVIVKDDDGGSSAQGSGGSLNFAPFSILATEQGAGDFAIGDYNEDGLPDVAAAFNTGSYPNNPSRFAVFLGTGGGGFGAGTVFDPGAGCWTGSGLETGDVNNDGHLDLVMTHGGSNSLCFGNKVTVHLGDGAGGFTAPVAPFSTGGSIGHLAIADFDENNNADLAIPSSDFRRTLIHFGNGAGGFGGGPQLFNNNTFVSDLVPGDLNADGHLDLVQRLTGQNLANLYFGDGAGGFSGPQYLTTADSSSGGVTVGDYNEDTIIDVAVTNNFSNSVDIFLGTGGGAFATALNFPAGSGPNSLTTGDFDGDGHLDLAIASTTTAAVSIATGDGNGSFATPLPFGTGANPGGRVRAADFDGDGRLDLAASSGAPSGISILLNQTTGGPETVITTVKNVAPELTDLSVTPMIFENGTATLTGKVVDPGTLDTFDLDINWGDPLSPGNTQTVALGSSPINSGGVQWNPATRQFSVDHQYLDDNPTNTAQDDYTIQLSVTDDDGGTTASLPLADAVSRWSAEGSAVDSVDGNDGTLVGGVTFGAGRPGITGQGFEFDGASGRVVMGNPANLNFGTTGAFSIEAWFNWDGGGSSVNNLIRKSNYPSSGLGAGYWLRIIRDTQTLDFFTGESVGYTGIPRGNVSTPVTPNQWHHAIGVRDSAGTMKLYLDGVLQGSVFAPNANTTSAAPFLLGAWDDRFGVIEFFSGAMDEVAVYDRGLTDAEVAVLYSGGAVATTTVKNVAPDFEAGPHETLPTGSGAFSRVGVTFTDPGTQDEHDLTVNYGDGSGDQTTTLAVGDRDFGLGHTYTTSGTFLVEVTVEDDDTGEHMDSFEVTVILNQPPVADANGPYMVDEGSSILLDASDSFDPNDTIVDYEWDYDYDGFTFDIDATGAAPTFDGSLLDGPDSRIVALRVRDTFGAQSDIDTTTLTIKNVAPTVTAVTDDGPVDEGSPVTVTISATDPAGALDPLTYWFDFDDDGVYEVSGGTNSAAHIYADNGTYIVGVQVTDGDGGVATATATVTVENVAPTVDAGEDQLISEGQAITLDPATFTDPGFDVVTAGTRDLAWIRQFGSTTIDEAWDLAAHGGNVYVGGDTIGTLPGQASAGGSDAFVSSFDTSGNLQWIRQFGTSSFEDVRALAADGNGVYAAGRAGGDAYVSHFDTAGNLQWTQLVGGIYNEHAFALAVDATGVYVAGVTDGSLPGQSSAGSRDAFVVRLDTAGNLQWTRQFGTSGWDQALGVAADGSGVYVTGYVQGALPGKTYAGALDAFVVHYDSAGNLQWTQQFGTAANDTPEDVAVDGSSVYLAGSTLGTLAGQTSAGDRDAFVIRLDTAGNLQWTRQFGTSAVDQAWGLTADANGVYVVGETEGTLPSQSSSGSRDAFVRRYSPVGDLESTRQFGSNSAESAWGVAADNSGLYVAGHTDGALPGQTNAGLRDVFVAKFQGGPQESFTATIDWGDGTTEPAAGIMLTRVPGSEGVLTTGTIDASHTYADDGVYTVTVSVTDDDDGTGVDTFLVTVGNRPPVVDAGPDRTALEGEFIQLQSTGLVLDGFLVPPVSNRAIFADPGFDNPALPSEENFEAVVMWGDGTIETTAAGEVTLLETPGTEGVPTIGTIQASHAFADDGVYTVTVRIWDDDMAGPGPGAAAGVDYVEDTFTVTVANVSPTITGGGHDAQVCSGVGAGDDVTVSVDFRDPGFDYPTGGTLEDFTTSTIDWGDGTVDELPDIAVSETPGSPGVFTTGAVSGSHAYTDGGIYTITVTIIDDDGGSAQFVSTAFVSGVGFDPGTGILYIIGTPGDDHVSVNKQGNDKLKVHADFLPSGNFRVIENASSVNKIIAYLCEGDDHLTIAGNIAVRAVIHGGGGDDHLNAGGGPAVLLGDAGNDMLVGGSGRDVMIGGVGRDRLVGGNDDDVLIGGSTTDDDDDDRLLGLLAVWTSANNYDDRVAAIDWLLSVEDDKEEDVLTGSAGRDLFYDGLGDVLTDVKKKKDAETVY